MRKLRKHRISVIIETDNPIHRDAAIDWVNHALQRALETEPIDEFISEPKEYTVIEDVSVC